MVVAAVAGATLLPGGRLVIVGTDADDDMKVNPDGGAPEIKVMLNGQQQTFLGVTQIVVFANGGDDFVPVAGGITVPVVAFGGAGNDRIDGGNGNNVLVGGAGRNVLIGGQGADRIKGSGADDLLVSGSTAFDANPATLLAVQAVWVSPALTFAERVGALGGTGPAAGAVVLAVSGPNATDFDDTSADVLTGNAGLDWFVFTRTGGVLDQAVDMTTFEDMYDADLSLFGPYVGG